MASASLFFMTVFLLFGLGMSVSVEEVVPAAPEPVAPPVVVVKESPGVVAPPAATPQQAEGGGNGFITEHKNPDGSTITITRFNGPLPASSFPQHPFGGGYGGGGPFNPYFPWGYPHPGQQRRIP